MKKKLSFLFFFNTFCFCQKVKIVELKPNEYLTYKQLRIKAVQECPDAFGSTYKEEIDLDDQSWKRRLKLNMLFAQTENQIVGMIGAKIDTREKLKHSAHIISFYVLPKFRNKKIGFSLINKLIEKLKKEKNIKRFTLHVTTTAINAIKLYKKLGFTITGTAKEEYFIDGKYYDQYLMILSLID